MSGRGIAIRRVSITDPRDMPTKGIAETPGGTCFGTTPGGTRIIYDRLFLLRQKQTPAARTPPTLPQIPGVTRDLDESHATGDHPKDRRVSVIEEATEDASNEQQDESQSNEKQNEESFQEAQVEDDVLDDECDMEM